MNNQVRFWGGGWRKAQCSVCWCLVAKSSIESHAMYHVGKKEGHDQLDGAYGGHNDVTVLQQGGKKYTVKTGWVTESTGPL